MAQDTWIGKKLGSYHIARLIGKGGSGRVYEARHTILGREAAIKMLRADLRTDDEHHERFLKEARTIARMRHPRIVQLYDFGMVQDTYYMVMEYIQGSNLQRKLEAARSGNQLLSGVEVWRLIKQMGEGLTYLHERGVIHRDIKPANILLSLEGNVVISDFGVSKLLAGHGDTSTGTITGTPAYMAPEQALGEIIDHRADLYAMAVIVYEMLAGRVPFEAESPLTVILKHVNERVPPLRRFNPAIPPGVETELLRALAKRPENRHQSVVGFLHALAGASSSVRSVPSPAMVGEVETVIGPDGKAYVHVPPGAFWMGSPHDKDAPRHRVHLDGFYISRYPVTNAEYHAFVEATGYMPPEHWHEGVYKDWEADHPVVYVNWHDAAAYCRWAGGRLPTEAEWEKAARGENERRYPWGHKFEAQRCNTREGGRGATSPVGKHSPDGDSPFGAGDMAGNVWEWTRDWYAPAYGDLATTHNPEGPNQGKAKVIRGGSFGNNASLVTCYTRDRALPEVCAVNYGFRVRLSAEVFELNADGTRTARANAGRDEGGTDDWLSLVDLD